MNTENNGYFNLHANGFGYFQRAREVQAKGGKSYVACDINSLQGPSNETRKLRFDLIVTGESAQADVDFICNWIIEQQLEDPKVLVSFRASDLDPQFFIYQHGANKGSHGSCIKARLIRLTYCSINGQVVQLPSAQASGEVEQSEEVIDELPTQPEVALPPVVEVPAPHVPARAQQPARAQAQAYRPGASKPVASSARYPQAVRR